MPPPPPDQSCGQSGYISPAVSRVQVRRENQKWLPNPYRLGGPHGGKVATCHKPTLQFRPGQSAAQRPGATKQYPVVVFEKANECVVGQ